VLFPTVRFAAFFMVVWALLVAVRRRPTAWRVALVAANWFFYLAWDTAVAWVLAASVAGNHVVVRRIAGAGTPRARQAWLWAGVAANVAGLAWFKYYGFFADTLADLAGRAGLRLDPPVLDVALPLGISFFTFQAISYLIEVDREVLPPARAIDEVVWLTFFPTVVSGPITRASELIPQLDVARERPPDAAAAGVLIARGLFLKVVVASYLASALVDDVFAAPEAYPSPAVLVAVYAFGAQLYADFAGYTDIARGCALLVGIQLPENFDAPYRARSVREFWNRWHLTLSRWLRDFVFTPLALGGSRRRITTYRNLVVVMLLAGLWHGAAWTFVAFGAVHGVALAAERWWRDERRRRRRPVIDTPLRRAVAWFVTFNVVSLGWLFFRAPTLGEAFSMLGGIATRWESPSLAAPVAAGVTAAVVAAHLLAHGAWERVTAAFATAAPAVQVVLLAGALVVIDVLGPEGVAPFIYFRF
jgi:D-alanyl-lipoteichoic acid acyltransferase DltB (MBOAT superfamily)